MAEPITPEPVSPDHEIVQADLVRSPGARIIIDPASPSVRSILRVVVITLLLLLVAGSVQIIVSSLTSLFFLICLSVFFASPIDPLVRPIRMPFEVRNLEWLMPRSAAIIVAYIFVFAMIGIAAAYIAPRATEQAREFGTNLPAYAQSLRQRSNELNQRFDRLRVPDSVQDEVNRKITDLGASITETVGNFVLGSIAYLPWLASAAPSASFYCAPICWPEMPVTMMV